VEIDVDQLAVGDHGEIVGVCARIDILEAGLRPLEHEEVEPGWLRSLRQDAPEVIDGALPRHL
jgi:hypothetical protein